MKNKLTALLCAAGLGLASTGSLKAQEKPQLKVVFAESESQISYPLDVFNIIDSKCYGCHSPQSRNEDSKEALQWIDLQDMEAIELLAIMDEIEEVLEEGKMPPEKIVEKYPHMKLTEEETARLKTWAEATMNGLAE